LDSADAWIIHPKSSPAFELLKDGNDVWLGNSRGNKYSLGHKTLDCEQDEKYWEFSFYEMGRYDAPAVIKYIREVTGRSKITYLGHSEGTTQMFYSLTNHQVFWEENIAGFIAFAPLTRFDDSKLTLFK